jgi:hypothetical protein
MTVDLEAARYFIANHARVLERHRLAHLLDDGPTVPVIHALMAYQNPDGGFGHALEPDVRGPGSQPAATLTALEIAAEIGAVSDPLIGQAADWIASIAAADGGVPTVLPSALGHPRAPWMEPSAESGFLTFALAGALHELDVRHEWLDRATAWCWAQLDDDGEVDGYTVKFALDFLDAVPDPVRAEAAIERLRPAIGADGTVAVSGGVEGEQLAPLDLSGRPRRRSRALFTDELIATDLDRVASEQLDDGGWDFHFLHWSPAQALEWRGIATLSAVRVLVDHGRVAPDNNLPASGRLP